MIKSKFKEGDRVMAIDELKPISVWLKIIRSFSPGNLTTFKY